MPETIAAWNAGEGRLEISVGDITRIDFDAVVNAANSGLKGGGGVDGAIHRAAGAEKLQAACREIIAGIGRLPAGKAAATPGFALPAETIIHTVGPIWNGGGRGEAETLASAYRESLELAASKDLQSVAFPAISCGAYGFPLDSAAEIAVRELKAGLERGLVNKAAMVLFDGQTADAFKKAAENLFGPAEEYKG
jgi:O-acetyl-ADP-ribose deacetylase (regulator of RNase III)